MAKAADEENTTAVARAGGIVGRVTGPLVEYFRDTRAELRKVTWPTREEARNLTALVLVIMIALAILLGTLDALFTQGLDLLFKAAAGG